VPEPFDRRIVSVLFADVVGFTPLSERLDAEDVATIQDAYFSATRETIQRYGGVLEKFIGDAAMAVFGAPRARDDDAERAVRAGLALLSAIQQIGARLGLEPDELQLRVGVNTGEVVHATSGPDAGRVTGDTVNTAARFQAAARPGTVLIGELTALTVADVIETTSIGTVELKGKAEPMRAWEAVAARSQPSREAALGALKAPMLGRDTELERLAALTGGRCLIVAPPGVGKSRLLAELAKRLPGTVLRARVRPQGTAPYETVAQLMGAAGGLEALPERLAAAGVPAQRAGVVATEVGRLLDPAGATAGSSGDMAAEREVRFDAWLTALDALVAGRATWLVEDVHWAGGDLLAFVDHAGHATHATHGERLIVATARPSLLETAPEWCAGAERLDLAPLPATDAAQLVTALIGDALPPELVAAVVERADGTPLFIEELLRTWASVGTLVRDGTAWRLAVQPESVVLPQTVQAIYAAQLDDLPPDARSVARRGAVAGRRVPVNALSALDLADGQAGLEALHRRAFVDGPLDDPVTGASYADRHALLRDAGYASLARAERARLHVAMARWLAEAAGPRADLVAEGIGEHLASALDSLSAFAAPDLPDRDTLARDAATWHDRAAEAAVRLAAVDAARRLLRRAAELTPPQDELDAARRRLRLGEVLAQGAELDQAITEIEAARATFAADPTAREPYERATYALGRAYMQQIRFPEAIALTEEGITRLGEDAVDPLLARLHALHAWARGASGLTDGVAEEADAALAAARAAGDPERELDVLEHWCAARDELDVASEDDWAQLEEGARRLGHWHQVVVAARVRAMHRSFVDPAGALAPLEATAELASVHGLTEQAGWADYARCETLWVLGRWDEALAVGVRALDVAERFSYGRLAFRTFMILLPMAAVRGDAALADRWGAWWAVAEAQFPPNPSAYGRMLRGAYLVWLSQARGEPVVTPADDLVDAVIPMINPHFLAATETVVRAWLDAGRTDLARAATDRLVEVAVGEQIPPLVHVSIDLLRGWLGDADAARRAVDGAREASAPWWESRASLAANLR
jgi:class 3 adenylate cyclase/tetratricopeptide (TPR) repeat protein